MTIYVCTIYTYKQGEQGNDAVVDPHRCEAVVRGFCAGVAESLPLQKPARRFLPPLLFCMACDVLTVRLLSPEV
jgi:hypothetical protein